MKAMILALPLALVGIAAPAAAQEMHGAHGALMADGTVLTLTVEGRTTRVPDVAIINAGVVTQAATAAEALSLNSQRMTRVLAALRAAGVAERDIQTATIQLSPQYRYQENQPPVITGYQASNSVSVRFRDVGKSGAILDALVKEGANSISGPELTIDKPEGALDEARGNAMATARARATLYAQAAGMRVDRILSISEGSEPGMPQPVAVQRMRAEAAADSTTEVVPGEREVTVSVTVRFLLK